MSLASILILLAIIYLVILIIEKLWLPLIISALLVLAAGVVYFVARLLIGISKWASVGSSSLVNGLINRLPGMQGVAITNVSMPWWITMVIIIGAGLVYFFVGFKPIFHRKEEYGGM